MDKSRKKSALFVACIWVVLGNKLENGEINVMGDISYTDERAQRMLFSDEPMGEEKYILYADLSHTDIGVSDFKDMDGKRVGVLMDTEPDLRKISERLLQLE